MFSWIIQNPTGRPYPTEAEFLQLQSEPRGRAEWCFVFCLAKTKALQVSKSVFDFKCVFLVDLLTETWLKLEALTKNLGLPSGNQTWQWKRDDFSVMFLARNFDPFSSRIFQPAMFDDTRGYPYSGFLPQCFDEFCDVFTVARHALKPNAEQKRIPSGNLLLYNHGNWPNIVYMTMETSHL